MTVHIKICLSGFLEVLLQIGLVWSGDHESVHEKSLVVSSEKDMSLPSTSSHLID